jgi:A/G-specific adenine glycosylase
MTTGNSLLNWYNDYKRDLPWRKNPQPYNIWISEIILQQTQMSRGVAYYERFIEQFPDIQTLAAASENEILLIWQGLGYYSRARNMLQAANQIMNDFNGEFPDSYDDLMQLKGIGDYTACAILSIAYNKSYVVADGNVLRVFSRLLALKGPVGEKSVIAEIKAYAMKMMNGFQPSEFNQAIMELGALVCKPKTPQCDVCPLNKGCLAYKNNRQTDFPVKKQKVNQKTRFFHYFMFIHENKVFLQKRIHNDIWKNLWEFPLIVQDSQIAPSARKIKQMFDIQNVKIEKIACKQHVLTHQRIEACFYIIETNDTIQNFENALFVHFQDIHLLPVHNLMKWGLNQLQLYLKQ